jgi:glycosyltransferase involved in cell wall biosynthesis
MVVIKCFTYNHGKHIEETLKGFVMQKTNFPFCALVVDDFSSDDTAQILRQYEKQYPEIIKGVYLLENYYSQGGIKREKTEITSPWFARCKYFAFCEGDDYWTDPLKLQKQVDFLEANPDYVVCSHHFDLYDESTKTFKPDWFKHIEEDFEYDLASFVTREAWMTQPLTVLYRSKAWDQSEYKQYNNAKDVTLFYYLLRKGKGMLLKDNMGIYRIHSEGIWSKVDKGKQTKAEMLTAMGVYDVHKDRSSAMLLANSAYRFPGTKFFKENGELYRRALKIIYKELGIKWWWKFLKKTCNPNRK